MAPQACTSQHMNILRQVRLQRVNKMAEMTVSDMLEDLAYLEEKPPRINSRWYDSDSETDSDVDNPLADPADEHKDPCLRSAHHVYYLGYRFEAHDLQNYLGLIMQVVSIRMRLAQPGSAPHRSTLLALEEEYRSVIHGLLAPPSEEDDDMWYGVNDIMIPAWNAIARELSQRIEALGQCELKPAELYSKMLTGLVEEVSEKQDAEILLRELRDVSIRRVDLLKPYPFDEDFADTEDGVELCTDPFYWNNLQFEWDTECLQEVNRVSELTRVATEMAVRYFVNWWQHRSFAVAPLMEYIDRLIQWQGDVDDLPQHPSWRPDETYKLPQLD